MFGYATNMRSNTQGRATFSMHFSRYEEAPRAVAEEMWPRCKGKVRQELSRFVTATP